MLVGSAPPCTHTPVHRLFLSWNYLCLEASLQQSLWFQGKKLNYTARGGVVVWGVVFTTTQNAVMMMVGVRYRRSGRLHLAKNCFFFLSEAKGQKKEEYQEREGNCTGNKGIIWKLQLTVSDIIKVRQFPKESGEIPHFCPLFSC